jgi:phage terminase large subunit-like protein
VDFAEQVLGVVLFPWQRWLLIHALELRPEGGFRFRNVVVLVARQNGKSTLSQVLALWFMYVYGYDLVLGTAQDLDTAEEVWQGAVDLVTEVDQDDQPVRPDLFDLYQRTVMVNGKKSLELKTGARYKAKAASRRSGRGLSGDLVMLDELREHQSWDAWGAITKTTMARDEAQIWALSNAGDSLSVVLDYLRKMAHAAIGDPDGINGESDPAVLLAGEVDGEDLELEDDDSLGIF